jgi:hypothetical protein
VVIPSAFIAEDELAMEGDGVVAAVRWRFPPLQR